MSPDRQAIDALRIDRANAPRRRWPLALLVSLLLIAGAVGAGAWWLNQPRPVAIRSAVVQEVTSGTTTLLNASGYVTARREATVSSKVTGKVVEVMIEEGMKVEADQVLARLDASNVQHSLYLAEAQIEAARKAMGETQAALEQAQRDVDRLTRLVRDQTASQLELDRAETELKTLTARRERQTAEVAVGEREVGLWKQQVEDTIIRAPFAGVVTSKNAQPGEMISPISAGGGFTRTGICTIVDMNSLEIEVDVSESYINRVRAGLPVEATLDAYPNWQIPCKVIAIIPTADRQKATVKVRVGFEQLDPRVLPDMSVKVAFRSASNGDEEAKPGLLVPQSALIQRDGKDVLWVVREGKVERRAVAVGAAWGEQVSIAAGLNGGERVVIQGADKLVDGAAVTETK